MIRLDTKKRRDGIPSSFWLDHSNWLDCDVGLQASRVGKTGHRESRETDVYDWWAPGVDQGYWKPGWRSVTWRPSQSRDRIYGNGWTHLRLSMMNWRRREYIEDEFVACGSGSAQASTTCRAGCFRILQPIRDDDKKAINEGRRPLQVAICTRAIALRSSRVAEFSSENSAEGQYSEGRE